MKTKMIKPSRMLVLTAIGCIFFSLQINAQSTTTQQPATKQQSTPAQQPATTQQPATSQQSTPVQQPVTTQQPTTNQQSTPAQQPAVTQPSATPESLAKDLTDKMKQDLTLTDAQYQPVYNVNLKYSKLNSDILSSNKKEKEKLNEVKSNLEAKEKELKGILTKSQYKKYESEQK